MNKIISNFTRRKMSNQSKTLIFTNLIFTNCPIPISDDILTKLLARQCMKHGDIEYCNVNGSKNTAFVKFQSMKDAIFVQKLMNNQILFKSNVHVRFSEQRERISKILEELLKN